MKSRLSKFGVGIFIWNMKGEISIDNPDDVERVRQILKILNQTPGFDFFDNVFNECSHDTVCEIIGLKPMCLKEKPEVTFDYSVYPIKSYKDIMDIESWRSFISEESYNVHTANGNRFYVLGNGDWWDVPCAPGVSFPHDNYGYSLVLVKVSPDNKINSVTSRWNSYADYAGVFMTEGQLKHILGEKYNQLFF